MVKRIENSKQRLRDKIDATKEYLEEDHYDVNELIRLKGHLEKKRAQFEKDFKDYENESETDDDLIAEYENLRIEGEEVYDDLEHYINVTKREQEKQAAEKRLEREKEERRLEAEEREKERHFELEKLEMEERKIKVSMEEKIAIEKLHVERTKVETSERIAIIKERENLTVKLPKLEMKKFDGNILKWKEFWDAFESTIDNNKKLHDVDKFNYLKNQLSGVASEMISGLELTKENYKTAVELLKERYGRKQFMIDAHYAKLMNMPMATYRATSLRSFYDTTETHLRCLRSLGESDDQMQILSMLKSKLPRSVLVELEKMKDAGEEWTIKRFRELLKRHIDAQEAGDLHIKLFSRSEEASKQQNRPNYNEHYHQSPKNFTGETLFSNETAKKTKYGRKCIFCSNNHWSDECLKYPDIQSRKKQLRGRCLRCMKDDHEVKDCKVVGKLCFHCGEKDKHHRTLCPKKFTKHDERKPEKDDKVENSMVAVGEKIVMQTALTRIQSKDQTVTTRAMLDTGSSRTYITEDLANQLQLKPVDKQTFFTYAFGNSKPKQQTAPVVEVKLQTKDGQDLKIRATVTKQITGPLQRVPIKLKCRQNIQHKYDMADTLPTRVESYTLGLLIGNDHYYDIMMDEREEIQDNLYLVKSKLGWIMSGRTSVDKPSYDESTLFVLQATNRIPTDTHEMTGEDPSTFQPNIENFWRLETIGIKPQDNKSTDELAMDSFKNSVRKGNDRYYVSWPWKENASNSLPENYELSLGRLKSSTKRFDKEPELLKRYNDIIMKQLDSGIVERVPSTEIRNNNRKHYIPHHGVITPDNATTKLRIVYDASSKTKKSHKSLNECMHKGDVIMEDLCSLLLRFRTKKIGIIADIEKAFLQIGLHEADRDVTRFFWLKDINKPLTEDNIEVLRFTRLPFGIISSPFLLGATVQHHLEETKSSVADTIKKNMYVDNVITGTDNEEDGIALYEEGKEIFQKASMNLREWITNSNKVNDAIKPEDRIKSKVTKVLGLVWNTNSDELSLSMKRLQSYEPATTKREVLTTLASIYDPLGMMTPVTIKMKIFLQELWEKEMDWDDPLDDTQKTEWMKLTRDLSDLSTICLPRFIGRPTKTSQLLCFCDSSSKAYATAVYLRTENDGKIDVNLIFSKSRNAPKKKITIPRLELMSTLIGVRCLRFISKELGIEDSEKILWTDSQCVLSWIQQKEQTDVFVRNRVSEIKNQNDIVFRYINTKHNPSDLPTRGMTVAELKVSKLWWNGPDWLTKKMDEWPTWNTETVDPDYDVKEDEKKIIFEVSGIQPEAKNEILTPFGIDETRYSSLHRLLRVTAYVTRFIKGLKKRRPTTDELTADEINNAELLWIKYLQKKHYLAKNGNLTKTQKQNQLNPVIFPDGIIRLEGRLVNSDLSEETIRPILLPRTEYFTKLLITKIHEEICHSGVSHTLSQLRQKYWIPQGRTAIKSVLRRCLKCIRHQGGPYKAKKMAPWPKSKVTISAPFTNTGIDYFGPLYVKDGSNQRKSWVCLFTCVAVRAVHLELVEGMSTETFLEALRRFIARRGKPDEIISDNATQFKAAKNTIDAAWKNVVNDPDVYSYLSEKGIKWNHIIELSPWMGGFYERLVGSTKMALKKSIGRLHLTQSQLQTIITEIEGVINSRPLVYVDNDIETQIITPMHFLSLNPKSGTPLLTRDEEDEEEDPDYQNEEPSTTQKLLDTWKRGNMHLDQFWKVWRNQYLINLRERSQRTNKHPRIQAHRQPKIGDVVQIGDSTPRGTWKVGRIVEMIKSRDGEERAARVLMPNKNILNRSIVQLYPIECQDDRDDTTNDQHHNTLEKPTNDEGNLERTRDNEKGQDNKQIRNRLQRRAAKEARDKIVGQNLQYE